MILDFIADLRSWDAEQALVTAADPYEHEPALDVAALEAVGAGWDDPSEPLPGFYVDRREWFADAEDELAVRRRVRALTPADVEGRAA